MWVPKSVAGVLCALYLLFTALAVADDLRRQPTPLILGDTTTLIALPGLVVVMPLAQLLFGATEINSRNWLPVHVPAVLITAALVYLLGAAADWLLAAVFKLTSHTRLP
jgi:hypothetical protein